MNILYKVTTQIGPLAVAIMETNNDMTRRASLLLQDRKTKDNADI